MKEFRIQKAMELLEQTAESISAIASKVGYETQGKFTNAFKDCVQMTPSCYRSSAGHGRTYIQADRKTLATARQIRGNIHKKSPDTRTFL